MTTMKQMTSDLGNGISEAGIAEQKPTTGRDSVRLVLEFLWPQFVEIVETKRRRQKQII